MASPQLKLAFVFLLAAVFLSRTLAQNLTNPSSKIYHFSAVRSFCQNNTPYPDLCFDSLKLSVSIGINPDITAYLLQSLRIAISQAGKLSAVLLNNAAGNSGGVLEKQRGTMQDCQELHRITFSSLERSLLKIQSAKPDDARAYLSASLTNKNTCLEGLDSASGPLKPVITTLLTSSYKYVSNSLSILARSKANKKLKGQTKGRRLMGINNNKLFTSWLSRKDRRILQSSEYSEGEVITVASDGTRNFTTITDAVQFAPNNSNDRTIIYVTQGVYEENVEIPSYKTNIVFIGDGTDATVITGNRSVGDSWTTFRSATLAVSGDGFLARDITIENRAGPEKHQAVALRVNADLVAFYRCAMDGYQDTLYAHSFRQFYRECNISGTVDFIFGNAAVVFQACNIIPKMPLPGQFIAITAQSRDSPDEDTGISVQNCSVVANDQEVYSSNSAGTLRTYLGRPWRFYSRTVFLGTYLGEFVDPTGWIGWSGDQGLDTLYYGEYGNYGPGSGTDNRVPWLGYHRMDYDDAFNFTVHEFISGDAWLYSTSFPYDDGI